MEQTLNGAPADRGAHFSKKNISDAYKQNIVLNDNNNFKTLKFYCTQLQGYYGTNQEIVGPTT